MSFPDPAPRQCLRSHTVRCTGYLREDGLWDIEGEGHFPDSCACSCGDELGEWRRGEPIHQMWIRLTLDDSYQVKAVATSMDVFHKAACRVAPGSRGLVGLRIDERWNKSVRALLGGPKGCRHLLELLAHTASSALEMIESKGAPNTAG